MLPWHLARLILCTSLPSSTLLEKLLSWPHRRAEISADPMAGRAQSGLLVPSEPPCPGPLVPQLRVSLLFPTPEATQPELCSSFPPLLLAPQVMQPPLELLSQLGTQGLGLLPSNQTGPVAETAPPGSQALGSGLYHGAGGFVHPAGDILAGQMCSNTC